MGAFFSLRETLPPDQAEPLWRHVYEHAAAIIPA
jgi:hypothetical protein